MYKEINCKLLSLEHEFFDILRESVVLAETYLERGIFTPKFKDDALHIAIAANVDILTKMRVKPN